MEEITVTLTRDEWSNIAKFLSRKIGETVNPVPTMMLLQSLMNAGMSTEEM